ncbi:MAG TPA: nucleotidyltransferase domain-containing protein [Thermoanaerobaculia bacterium]|nr:nucleotidyltransferase domain-containing protein [Thermoanaerobaculia bacterium]
METSDPVVEALRGALRGRKDVRLALLFGSRARGRARPGSDADVAVLGKDLDLLELAADLSTAARVEVDVVSLEDPGYPLLNALLRDSIVLHEGERGAAATWRSHALLIAELDGPGYIRMRDAFLKKLAAGHHHG